MSAVEVDRVWKYYGDYAALRDIDFKVGDGDCVALLGRNGAGKTTLLRIIAGLSKPARGQVRIAGGDVRDQQTRRRIGILGHLAGPVDGAVVHHDHVFDPLVGQ